MDKTARKEAKRHRQLNKRCLLFPSLAVGGLPTGQNGPAKNPADSAKAEEVRSEAGIQLDRAAQGKARRRRQLEKKHFISQLDRLCTVQNGENYQGLESPGSHHKKTAEKLANSAKTEEVGSEAGCQLDKTASQFDGLSADQNGGDSQMES